ncbi:innate immunity activator protein [Bombina bombina]|uniref:innate immunity activator protein n=1 Tax=Bombina bombina TaxID=8345 RepID=UPI00235A8A2F|nr:innate immunity activator protein [Bombina bombina]XP_053562841.1 innate immunity activator protein [Bombina bombina]
MGMQEESSDTGSHYIIQPGPEVLSPGCKELTQAVRIQQRSLEQKLQNCLDELRRICLREAELTGVLSKEYPLKKGETPPKVRRRVGALFSLDERTIQFRGEDPLSNLERDLALQRQITEAARRLYLEDSLAKPIRRQRKEALRAAERKLIALEERLNQERSHGGSIRLEDSSVSESSSLSDVTVPEEDDAQRVGPTVSHSVTRPLPPQTLEGLRPLWYESDTEKSPLRNSPWKESSLDLPYEKKGTRKSRSQSSSPAVTPLQSPQETPAVNGHVNFSPALNIVTLSIQSSPESANRKGISHSVRVQSTQDLAEPRGRPLCRRATSFNATSNSVLTLSLSNPMYNSSNMLDCNDNIPESLCLPPSYKLAFCPVPTHGAVPTHGEVYRVVHTPLPMEHSRRSGPSRSAVTEELQSWHVRARMKGTEGLRPRSLDRQGAIKLRSGASWSQLSRSQTQRLQIPSRQVLRRTAEGTPMQWYDPEEAQIISQV